MCDLEPFSKIQSQLYNYKQVLTRNLTYKVCRVIKFYRRRQYYNVLNKILCMLTVTAISVLLSSSATSRTRHIGIEYMYKKGGQVTKPIIVVKIPCKLLYQKIKLSVPQLIHIYVPIYNAFSIVNLITLKLNFDKLRPAIFL